MGNARDRVARTTPMVPQVPVTGQLVQAGQSDAIPLGSGGDETDFDQETWDAAMAGAAGVDSLVEFARFASSVAMPIQDGMAGLPPVPKISEREAGTQPMAEQGRRTRSPRSTLRRMVAAGRPPMNRIVEAFTYPSTPLSQRAMPLAQMGTLVVPPLPGGSLGGCDIDVDDLLAAAVET